MSTKKYEELQWQQVTAVEQTNVIREAERYCPEFPFEPAVVEKATNLTSFYTEDYELVRLSAVDQNQQVWGFYARGDFHPLDARGRAFEELNEIGPLQLNLTTVLDYTLLRLRFELNFKVSNAQQQKFRIAQIVSRPEDLPPGRTNGGLAEQLTEPRVEMAPEWELQNTDAPYYTQRGLIFRVVAFAVVFHTETEWELVQAFAQIEPDGTFTIRLLDAKQRNPRVNFKEATRPPIFVLSPQRTRTALPICKWKVPAGSEADALLKLIETCHVETATGFHEGDLKDAVSLANKMVEGADPVSLYLQTRFNSETLNKWKEQTEFKSAIVKEPMRELLNETLSDASLFAEERFAKITLSEKTRNLLARKPAAGRELARLNRSLLEDAYPNELLPRRIIVRLGELPFYPDCKLLEVLVTKPNGYRRGYVVLRMEDGKPRFHPLIGSSVVVHQLNEKTRLDLTDGKETEYLRFFCWAMNGEEGPFYVPRAFREIPLLVAPSTKQRAALSRLDFSISRVEEAEQKARGIDGSKADYVLMSQTVYGSQLSQTWFAVHNSGGVEMLQDETQIVDLLIYKERYGDGPEDLIKLAEPSYGEPDEHAEQKAQPEREPSSEQVEPEKPDEPWPATDDESVTYPRVLWNLSFVKRILLYDELKTLRETWSKFPVDKKVTPVAAPQLTPAGQKLLEQIKDEHEAQQPALRFLKAQLLLPPPDAEILPSVFLRALQSLISEICPDRPVTAAAFLELIEKNGHCARRLVNEVVFFDTTTLTSEAPDDETKTKTNGSEVRSHVTISGCWFEREVSFGQLANGPSITFIRCFFAAGVIANEAELGQELSFVECVFGHDAYEWVVHSDKALNLENARLRGNLTLSNCSLKGAFYAPRLSAGNHVRLVACSISSRLENISEPATVEEIMERKWPKPEGQFETKSSSTIEAITLDGARIAGCLQISARDSNLAARAAVIDGSVSCADLTVNQNLYLHGASFEKAVTFHQARIAGYTDLTLVRIFEGRLDFSYTVLDNFSLARANVNGDISLYRSTISGNLMLLGLKTTGNFDLGFAKVRAFVAAFHTVENKQLGCLSIGRDLILSGIDARILELRGAEISGKIRIITGKFGRLIMSVGISPPKINADHPTLNSVKFVPKPCRTSVLEVTSVLIEENVDLTGLVVALPDDERKASQLRMDHEGIGILLNNSKIGRNLTFFTERISARLERRWKSDSEQRLPWETIPFSHDYGAKVWGNLVLKGNEIGGGLDLRNMDVTGDIYLNDTMVRFDVDMDAGDPNFDGFETRCKNLYAQKLDCSGDLKLSGLRVRENLRARQAKIKGELVFLPSQIKEKLGRGDTMYLQENAQATVGGDLDLSSVDVRGDLDLRSLNVKGDVLINDSSVGLDLNLDGSAFKSFATTCHDLNAEGIRCTGEIKLSGLNARGNFRGRDIQAGSEIAFLLSPQVKDDALDTTPTRASIGGNIDLVGAKANRLTISGENLSNNHLRLQSQGPSINGPAPARVTLERAQIGNVEIVTPARLGPVNLSGISVAQWAFSNCDAAESGSNVQNYIDVLKGLTPFDRSIWLDIEKLLRNQSEIGDANKVYREMRRKIRANRTPADKSWWSAVKLFLWRLWDGFKSFTLGYGTRVWRPMILALGLFVLSTFIFYNPDHVRASPNLLAVLPANTATAQKIDRSPNTIPGVHWTVGDSMILSLRYQVPIITALTHGGWEASDKPLFLNFTAEDYAFVMQIYHAIFWPIFLLGIAGQIIRGRQN